MPDLIPIDEAARMLQRKPRTLRWWDDRGFAPDGTPFHSVRDTFTKIRYFRRETIARVAAARLSESLPTAATR